MKTSVNWEDNQFDLRDVVTETGGNLQGRVDTQKPNPFRTTVKMQTTLVSRLPISDGGACAIVLVMISTAIAATLI